MRITDTIPAEASKPLEGNMDLNKMVMGTNDPRTKLGTVVVTVALRLVPNCSEALVTKIAQKPTEKPSPNMII